jgi:hypothetical protein
MADRAPAQPDAAPTLDLRIEELVLHGFERIDRHQVASAIEHELARLLREPAAHDPQHWRDAAGRDLGAERVDGGAFIVPHDASAQTVGVQVAQAIWRGVAPAAPAGGGSRGLQHVQPPGAGDGG